MKTLCLMILAASSLASAKELRRQFIAGETMGTTYHITYFHPQPLEGLQKAVDAQLNQINRSMSTYDPNSTLSRFNQTSSTHWFEMDEGMTRVTQKCLEISQFTERAFDCTIGAVVDLWGFGPTKNPKPPEELEHLMEATGPHLLELRPKHLIRKKDPRVSVDLSGIAKGYGVDQVAELLRSEGLAIFLVEIGGEVYAQGRKPDGGLWHLGIEKPDATGRRIQKVITLEGEGLATSGHYRNYYEKDGVRYSHIIDPRTGHPVTHKLASVSVIADDVMTADGLATALLVMGYPEALEFATTHKIKAFFLVFQEGSFQEHQSPLFPQDDEKGHP